MREDRGRADLTERHLAETRREQVRVGHSLGNVSFVMSAWQEAQDWGTSVVSATN